MFLLPEYKYAPSEEKQRTLTSEGCQCHVVHKSASSLSLTPGLSSSLFIKLKFIFLSLVANFLSPNPLQIRILPVTSPAATILWVGWKARTVNFFVWCRVIFLITARSDSTSGTFHIKSLRCFRTPKYFPDELIVMTWGSFICHRRMKKYQLQLLEEVHMICTYEMPLAITSTNIHNNRSVEIGNSFFTRFLDISSGLNHNGLLHNIMFLSENKKFHQHR